MYIAATDVVTLAAYFDRAILYDWRLRWFQQLMAEAKIHAVGQAALYSLTRKRRVRSAARAHVGVEYPHTGVTAGRLRKGQPASTVTLMSGHVWPTGLPRETFTFPLICTVGKGRRVIYSLFLHLHSYLCILDTTLHCSLPSA